MLRQPLTVRVGEEEDEECLKLFYTIQLHGGTILHTLYIFILLHITIQSRPQTVIV